MPPSIDVAGVPTRELAVHKDFIKDFARLEKPVQDRVKDTFRKFRVAELSGSHLEKINGAANDRLRSVRVTKSVRAIVIAPEHGRRYTLVKVLPHDDAYEWARRTRIDISVLTGRLEIWDPTSLRVLVDGVSLQSAPNAVPLFDALTHDEYQQLGIDEQVAESARSIGDLAGLDDVRDAIPPGQWDVLDSLAAGMTPAEIISDAESHREGTDAGEDELDAAIERSDDQVRVVSSDDELERILDAPFDLWRTYLHPSQRSAVDADFRGPARITGGPGTGKTVVCVHRARRMAERGDGYVLLTTYNKALADAMETSVDLLVGDSNVRRRIKVRTVDSFARRVFVATHGELDGDPHQLLIQHSNIWRRIIRDLELTFSPAFLNDEFTDVVLAQQVSTEEQYLAARRLGRGQRLGANQRKQVWSAVCRFEAYLKENHSWTFDTLRREAVRLLNADEKKHYRYVIIDEAQDLTPDHWRLLKAAVPDVPDNIFIAGDAHQRIYNHRASLRSLGISIAGRSRHLTLNHRTSAEILRWALTLLGHDPVDDLDLGRDTVRGYRSAFHGYQPTVREFDSTTAEFDYMAETVALWIESDIEPRQLAIAVRERAQIVKVIEAMSARDIKARKLADLTTAVAVATMHSLKGLEFRCLAVVGVDATRMPLQASITPESEDKQTHAFDMQRERQLLFVACTRAREDLVVTWTGERSPFIPTE
ncbi:UvrD-helicase domain-containing protein [Nocardia sp. 348MFTsu5.1]|uniref:UvrD-helicase domain-containing protein n=1 Tax=Nocardia sp. 348MFTsu5.1 TaxID=1172185 RepID=UPI0003AA639B|nr:UvrD-helicase domain-containing protein [Nocardia sp. 348MFTsu5.1]